MERQVKRSIRLVSCWDYRNRLTQSQLNGTTTSYLYDVNDERIALGANGSTTTYPFVQAV
jgi:hypothetical protein